MTSSITHAVQLQPLVVPDKVYVVGGAPGRKQDGLQERPSFRVADLSEDTIRELCQQLEFDMLQLRRVTFHPSTLERKSDDGR